MSRPAFINAICVAAIAILVFSIFQRALGAQSADLFALWLAGEFMAMDRLDQIYPANTTMFDMTTPSEWWAFVSGANPTARIFPYLYPPIWAKLASWLTQLTTFETFDTTMTIVHQALIIASIYLAAKMCDLKGTVLFGFIALTYGALAFTYPIGIAIEENQPQVVVSFLIVWAFERAHFDHQKAAGVILAFAAAIKLYPLLFVVIFAARRQWGAIGAFAVVGVLLGGASIWLTGWDLHAEYLHLISLVSKSVIVNNFTFSIDSGIARLFFLNNLSEVRLPGSSADSEFWGAMLKPAIWAIASLLANLAAILAVYLLAARRPKEVLVLPIAAIAFALLSPLSWCYSYMTSLVFAGVLPLKLGKPGLYIVVLSTVFFLPLMAPLTTGSAYSGPNLFQVTGTGIMLVMGVAFWFAQRTDQSQIDA